MTVRLLDGAVIDDGAIEWTWNEDVDDEGRRGGWWQCGRCDGAAFGDDSRARHICRTRCVQCEKELTWAWHDGMLPPTWVTDDERGSAFCAESDDNVHVVECGS